MRRTTLLSGLWSREGALVARGVVVRGAWAMVGTEQGA